MMKKVHVTFEPDPSAEDISIVFSASERDADVEALMRRIADPLSGTVAVSDQRGALVVLPENEIIMLDGSFFYNYTKRMTETNRRDDDEPESRRRAAGGQKAKRKGVTGNEQYRKIPAILYKRLSDGAEFIPPAG